MCRHVLSKQELAGPLSHALTLHPTSFQAPSTDTIRDSVSDLKEFQVCSGRQTLKERVATRHGKCSGADMQRGTLLGTGDS